MSRFKISTRLLMGFGLLMLVLAGVSGFSTLSASQMGQSLESVVRLKGKELLSQQVEKQVWTARSNVWRGFALGDSSLFAPASLALKDALAKLAQMQATTGVSTNRAAVASVITDVDAYAALVVKLEGLTAKNTNFNSPEVKAVMTEASALGTKVIAGGENLSEIFGSAATETADETIAQLSRYIVVSLVIGAVSLLIGIALSFLVSRSITLPIRSMTNAMLALADGKFETVIPALDNKDEIGEMAQSVDVFKRNMIEANRLRAEQSADNEIRLQRAQIVDDLTKNFEETAGKIVINVSSQAQELQMTAQSMASISEETSRQSNTVSLASGEALQNINTVAAATEELSASVGEILQQINRSTSLIGETVEQAGAANTEMQGLSSAMDRIGAVVELIRGIASQTNLLALNATIEAARAGEAGKGFAVVASEVKLLANQTAKATEDIAAQITSAQQATRLSVQSIQEISARIEGVSATSTAIASAVEEQGAATAEIARNVQEAARGSQEVASNISGVSNAAQESGAAASQVLSSAGSLSESSVVLRTQITEFLQGVRAA